MRERARTLAKLGIKRRRRKRRKKEKERTRGREQSCPSLWKERKKGGEEIGDR